MVDEHNTSKRCPGCFEDTVEDKERRIRSCRNFKVGFSTRPKRGAYVHIGTSLHLSLGLFFPPCTTLQYYVAENKSVAISATLRLKLFDLLLSGLPALYRRGLCLFFVSRVRT